MKCLGSLFLAVYFKILEFRLARKARASYSDLRLLKQRVGLIVRMMHFQPEAAL
jgi:hypothetical protein